MDIMTQIKLVCQVIFSYFYDVTEALGISDLHWSFRNLIIGNVITQ